MGILEKLTFMSKFKEDMSHLKYAEFELKGVMANCIGLLIILFCALVVYLVRNQSYKRVQHPEDEDLQYEDVQNYLHNVEEDQDPDHID